MNGKIGGGRCSVSLSDVSAGNDAGDEVGVNGYGFADKIYWGTNVLIRLETECVELL